MPVTSSIKSSNRILAFAFIAVPFALSGAGCTSSAMDDAGELVDTDQATSRGQMPLIDPHAHPRPAGDRFAPPGAHLHYYGGRVISNVEVVQVIYGAGDYLLEVTSDAMPSMFMFY